MRSELREALNDRIEFLRDFRSSDRAFYERRFKSLADLIYDVRIDMDEARAALAPREMTLAERELAAWHAPYASLSDLRDAIRVRSNSAQSTAPEQDRQELLAQLAFAAGASLYDVLGNTTNLYRNVCETLIREFRKKG